MNLLRNGVLGIKAHLGVGVALLCPLLLFASALAQTIPTRLGDLDADGQPTVLDLQRLLNHLAPAPGRDEFHLVPNLRPYADLNEDGAINQADVLLLQDAILGRSALPNPYAAPILNAPVVATNGNAITLTGTARPNRRILITGGRFAVFAIADSNGLFSAEVMLRANQVNAIFVTATNATFTAGIPQPVRVLQDSQPPNLFIDFPTNGATLYTESTIVAGRVGDSLSGYAGLTVGMRSTASQTSSFPAVVDVGIGNNGTYQRGDVPLVEGTNLISVTATDIHGNTTNRQITVVRLPLVGPRLLAISGDAQKTNIHRRLAQPIIVKATQADGFTPLTNRLLTFEVTRSDGRLLPFAPFVPADPAAFTNDINHTVHGVMRLQLLTDANGEARAQWAMGGDAGCGNNRVCVTSAGVSNNVYFCASADAALPHQINIGTGNNQKAETGAFLPEPLRAWVNDSCNGNAGLPVTFTVVQGGGRLFPSPGGKGQGEGGQNSGGSTITTPASRTGHAEVLFQLGPDASQNIVEANYPGNPNLPATFIAYGVARDPSRPTTLTGLLLDNTSCPIGGAACSLSVGGQMFFTATDAQGQFHFNASTLQSRPLSPFEGERGPKAGEGAIEGFNAQTSSENSLPSGPAQLFVDGSTATNLLGALIPTNSFPSLEFSLILIPNAENALPSSVLLPRLNLNNQRLYYGTNDLVLTCEGIEGLKMTIKGGSMSKPDGTLVTPANPANVSLNQVHHDNVPMPIPDGASPPFAWTLQPGGATFDPPIQIEYPNMSGLPAGTVAYFLSFNHDTRRFEIIASGHVKEDSATIATDPGAGLTISGWGCNCPPYSVTGECENECECEEEGGEPALAALAGPPQQCPNCPAQFNIPAITDAEALNMENGNTILWASTDPTVQANLTDLRARLDVFECLLSQSNAALVVTVNSVYRPQAYQDHLFAVKQADTALDTYLQQNPQCANACAALIQTIQNECAQHGICDNPVAAVSNHRLGNAVDVRRAGLDQTLVNNVAAQAGLSVLVESSAYHLQPQGVIGVCAPAPAPKLTRRLSPSNEQIGPETAGDGPDPELGTWHWKVNGQIVATTFHAPFKIPNITAPDSFGPGGPGTTPDFVGDDPVRVIGVNTLGGTNRYAFSDYFQVRQGKTAFIINLTFTTIPPRKPESLTIVCTNRILRLGQSTPLAVLARFADGTTTNVASQTSWTSYRVSNTNIATVSPDGVVTPLRRGAVYITAVNEGASAVCGLNVVGIGEGFTTVSGTVVGTNGLAVAGATVRIFDLAVPVVATDASGQFTILDVPATFGLIGLEVRFVLNGRVYTAFVSLAGVSGSETEVGTLTVRPLAAMNARFAAGGAHTVALRADGTLWTWGDNESGQLGNGTFVDSDTPQPLQTNWTWEGVAAKGVHTVAVRSDGTLWTWGDNEYGQLGNGTFTTANAPQPIQSNWTWQAVAAGWYHTVALRSDGALWAWGNNESGQLGDGTSMNTNMPQPIQSSRTWQAVAAGLAHTIALRADGTLWAWGNNDYGQLGDGTTTSTNTPQQVGTNTTWQAVAAGDYHTLAVRADGTLWAWGWNFFGQLGNGTFGGVASMPEQVGSNVTWHAVAGGYSHTLALTSDGTLWAWGENNAGQWGNGTFGGRANTPQPIQVNWTWHAVAAGEDFTLTLRADGTLWASGVNSAGQLGNGTFFRVKTPQQVGTNATWRAVAPGYNHTVALRTEGTLWTWGYNGSGQLGNATFDDTSTPQQVDTNATWQAVAAGRDYTVAVRTDGTLWAWGGNDSGQLGNGTFGGLVNTPQQVGTNANWQAVAAGVAHTVALRAVGTLWAWGRNDSGQLSDGTFDDANTPQFIATNATWQAVSCGGYHTAALRSDDTLWAWGNNEFGQLGNGTFTSTNTPQQIETNTTWRVVAAGGGVFGGHTLALRADGTLWTWGRNNRGQLGYGTFGGPVNTPNQVGSNTNWQAVAAGEYYSLGLRTDGTLWAWGENNYGQLGTVTSGLALTPLQVGTNSNWQAVGAGGSHTVALRADGTLWAWGDNTSGQIAQPLPWLPYPVLGGAMWGPPRP